MRNELSKVHKTNEQFRSENSATLPSVETFYRFQTAAGVVEELWIQQIH